MHTRLIRALFALLLSTPAFALAASDLVVERLIMPAWLKHDGRVYPLSVGMPLVDGDRLSTGDHARILLRASDGSDIKLGENATLTISQLSRPRNDPDLFTALLDVARGAFRFTTSAVAKLKHREVSIHVADATIGIRGTDVWGKDGDDKRVVCLIEGNITVQGKDSRTFQMAEPLTFYDMPVGLPAKAVAPVPMDKLANWAMETEIAPAQGGTSQSGRWKITLLSANDEMTALQAYDDWRSAGYDVSILPIPASNGHQFQLRITHLSSKADAQHLADNVRGIMGALEPVVSQ